MSHKGFGLILLGATWKFPAAVFLNREQQWKNLWSDVMNQNGISLFRRPSLNPVSSPSVPGNIHCSA